MEEQIGAIGFIVVTDAALAVGITAIPGPVTDAADDGWFVWEPFMQLTGSVVSGNAASPNPIPYFFDSKGMRKVQEGYSIVVVAENASGAFVFELGMGFSMLTSLS